MGQASIIKYANYVPNWVEDLKDVYFKPLEVLPSMKRNPDWGTPTNAV